MHVHFAQFQPDFFWTICLDDLLPIYQLVKLHNTITFQILHHTFVTFENVTLCRNIVLLHMSVTL